VPRQKHNFVFIKVIYYLTIVLAFAALTYSLVFEFDSYISFIKDSSYENSVKSFFEQKNNYGVILTLGSIATMFAMQDAKKLWSKITLFSILIYSLKCILNRKEDRSRP
jgi:VanZ family protein